MTTWQHDNTTTRLKHVRTIQLWLVLCSLVAAFCCFYCWHVNRLLLCCLSSLSISISISLYIYICCRVENLSNVCPFLSWKSVQKLFLIVLFLFSKIFFFLQGEWDFSKQKKKQKMTKITNFCVQNLWTDFQRNLGQIFNSTILLNFGLFSFLKKCRNHYFMVFSAKQWKFWAHPKN